MVLDKRLFHRCLWLATIVAMAGSSHLARAEDHATYEALFDGTSLNGWKHDGGWKIIDRALVHEGWSDNLDDDLHLTARLFRATLISFLTGEMSQVPFRSRNRRST